jgi:hypothetical protein
MESIEKFFGRFINDGQFNESIKHYAYVPGRRYRLFWKRDMFIPVTKLRERDCPTIFLSYKAHVNTDIPQDVGNVTTKDYDMTLIHNGKPVMTRTNPIYKSDVCGDNSYYRSDASAMFSKARKLHELDKILGKLQALPETKLPEFPIKGD